MAAGQDIVIQPVTTKAQTKQFIDIAYKLNAADPKWVPPLKAEVAKLITPGKNPFFEHAKVQFFLALRNGRVVGRISAHIDELALQQPPEQGMGPGTGNWGMMEASDEASMHALIHAAEAWLKDQGMTRVLAPISMSVWEEPGLLTKGHDQSPMIMMGHHNADYQGWIENLGYTVAKRLVTYDLPVKDGFPELINRIVASGERKQQLQIRKVDKKHFDRDAAIIMGLLNDAWSGNWGFVPMTDHEIDHAGKSLKPVVQEALIRIAEFDGEPVAFMMTLPNMNEVIRDLNGSLWPFGWAKLLWWLKFPKAQSMRVPLMGVKKELHNTRLASQLAFMMIEYIRRDAVADFGTRYAEIGWILEDNQGMVAIADAIGAQINREYLIYEKAIPATD
ncbi:MAG: N-acetyltransferase [Sphingomonadales bacterium]|nr:N-acetyltransferase [Sphingomonadales bacterium]PIX65145.1 MAG: N-acetyltransferase [Sphingomonadales bacterium CG_4_10_14_3_um_filter_58_15]NCO49022.1 N-acetyltransferase [Sphingomonadales bacterium]NCP00833.1 N-acetyltransferase [Sphingomonadales bacterium]NCP26197.1 N-acetyltransferase [Sphingomonadales bacterium]